VKFIPIKYSNLIYIPLMGFIMSLAITLIITYINTEFDFGYPKRFFKAWAIGLPIAIVTPLIVERILKKFVNKSIK